MSATRPTPSRSGHDRGRISGRDHTTKEISMATDTTRGSLAEAIAAPGGDSKNEVIPWGRAFLIDGHADAPIELDQYTAKDFVFVGSLSFVGDMGLDEKKYPNITAAMKQKARGLD